MFLESVFALLRYSAPVGLAALGETVGQKSGVINIGLEGSMLTAAFAAMVTTQATGQPFLGLACGAAVAVLVSAVQGFFVLKQGADQVVVGTAVNLLGLGLTGSLYRMRYGQSGQLLSVPKLPTFGPDADLVTLLLPLVVSAVSWALFRTGWGLVLRATGEYPQAARASGFSPVWVRWQGVLASGLFSGLGGAYLSVGIAGSFAENMTAGRGFVALAMVTFGRWRPWFVALAAVFIGYVDSLQYEIQAHGWGVPSQLAQALPYLAALVVLVLAGRSVPPPADLARPYPNP